MLKVNCKAMGIREYFKQHPEGEDLKIHNMVIKEKEPKSELLFDEERDLSEKVIQGIKDTIEQKVDRGDEWSFVFITAYFKILFPDKMSELRLDQRKEIIEDAKNELKNYYVDAEWYVFAVLARNYIIIFPNEISHYEPDKSALAGIKKELEQKRKDKNWTSFMDLAIYLKIFSPKEAINLNLDEFNNIQTYLETEITKKEWGVVAQIIRHARILYPEKKIKLNQEIIKSLQLHLKSYQTKKQWFDFAAIAMALKLLAAEDIKFTEQGLEIVSTSPADTDFKPQKSKRPERRNF